MSIKKIYAGFVSVLGFLTAAAQQKDSVRILKPVTVTGYRTVNGVGHLLETKDGIIYAGKKTEVILVDSLDANKAINNTRQILGRMPGLNIVETESSGFTANGIATRGLNPFQSIEMNSRQNGYNISADVYGYNEAYYIPPMEAVRSIELVRGASSLQFGAQFGGMVNYVLNDAPKDKPFEFTTSQTAGSFNMFNSFNSIGGTYRKWSYYVFLQYRNMQGWRPNSQQWQYSGFGKLQYQASGKLTVGVEYSLMQNRIQMPGGLTDSEFVAGPKSSFRARNWLKSPWNIITFYANDAISKQTFVTLKSTVILSSRSLVWRKEDGGPGIFDRIDPATNMFSPREVEHEYMHSSATELRVLHNYSIGKMQNTIAGGMRYAYAWFKRQEGGEGSTGSDFDLQITGEFENDLDFTTTNIAPFVENIFRFGNRFSLTPGARFEYFRSTATGYVTDSLKIPANESRQRSYPLFGIGLEYKTGSNTSLYGNISQAYRPMDYAEISPFGTTSVVDPHLKDQFGFNSDLGWRGTIRNYLNFDFSLFCLAYNRRIGTVLLTDANGNQYTYRTNVANSVNKGIESYIEFNLLKCLMPNAKTGLSFFNSLGYTDARYTSGEFKNNRVEEAVAFINRSGVIYSMAGFSATFQLNYTGDSFGDASNARKSSDPIAGYNPEYFVMDFGATCKINNYALKAGVNNLADIAYFTRRTDEYPGPGIIPAVGRSIYLGVTAVF